MTDKVEDITTAAKVLQQLRKYYNSGESITTAGR